MSHVIWWGSNHEVRALGKFMRDWLLVALLVAYCRTECRPPFERIGVILDTALLLFAPLVCTHFDQVNQKHLDNGGIGKSKEPHAGNQG